MIASNSSRLCAKKILLTPTVMFPHLCSIASCCAPQVDLYRSNAVRVLCQIVDSQLLAQIERYLKQVRRALGTAPLDVVVI